MPARLFLRLQRPVELLRCDDLLSNEKIAKPLRHNPAVSWYEELTQVRFSSRLRGQPGRRKNVSLAIVWPVTEIVNSQLVPSELLWSVKSVCTSGKKTSLSKQDEGIALGEASMLSVGAAGFQRVTAGLTSTPRATRSAATPA